MDTFTPTKERARDEVGGGAGDSWRVIVLNDNHNTFDGVAFALATGGVGTEPMPVIR